MRYGGKTARHCKLETAGMAMGAFTYAKMGDISNCDYLRISMKIDFGQYLYGTNRMTAIQRIIVADNYIVLRNELKAILEKNGQFRIVGEAGNGTEILHLLDRGIVPDALILDLMMPKMAGIEALAEIRRRGYMFPVLVLTMHKEPELLCQAFLTGATGYVLKDGIGKELVNALSAVLTRRVYLSLTMRSELPKTCRLAPCADQPLPLKFEHCRQSGSPDPEL
jgi:DNA-binding NarL/FixJ family response regulator